MRQSDDNAAAIKMNTQVNLIGDFITQACCEIVGTGIQGGVCEPPRRSSVHLADRNALARCTHTRARRVSAFLVSPCFF